MSSLLMSCISGRTTADGLGLWWSHLYVLGISPCFVHVLDVRERCARGVPINSVRSCSSIILSAFFRWDEFLKSHSFPFNNVSVSCIFKTLIIQSNCFFLLMEWCFQLSLGFEELTILWCQIVLWIFIPWPMIMASVKWCWQGVLPEACQSIDPPLQF